MNQENYGIYKAFFFDTYALIEIFKGNEAYIKYKNSKIITNILNLYELYYRLRKEFPREKIYVYFNRVKELCVDIYPELLIEASELRLKIKRNLSYADCLGYVMALRFGVKFLTGDKEFKDLPNVEFVK